MAIKHVPLSSLQKKVVSFEHDKLCFETLRTWYARNTGISLENVALGDREHVRKFFVEEEGVCLQHFK